MTTMVGWAAEHMWVGRMLGFAEWPTGVNGEAVAGVRGGDAEGDVIAGVTAILRNGMFPSVPGTDVVGESCKSMSRGPP